MRIAAVQVTASADPAVNRAIVAEKIAHGAAQGAALIVFPEAMAQNFGAASSDAAPRGESLEGPFVASLVAAASANGVFVVAGMFESIPGQERVSNSAVVVGPSGVIGRYQKVHLFDALGKNESAQFIAGDAKSAPFVFTVEGFCVGVLTCYDVRFPESARALVDKGADVIVVPAHWFAGPNKAQVWATLLGARAIENTIYVVGADKPAPECAGTSMIVDPAGLLLCAAPMTGETTLFATVSKERLEEVRAILPLLSHRRFGIVPHESAPS
jgi:predicted amidohydrolase